MIRKISSIVIAIVATLGMSAHSANAAGPSSSDAPSCLSFNGTMKSCDVHQEAATAVCEQFGYDSFVADLMPAFGTWSYVGSTPPYSPVASYEIHICGYSYELPAFSAAVQQAWKSFNSERVTIVANTAIQEQQLMAAFASTTFGSSHRLSSINLHLLYPGGIANVANDVSNTSSSIIGSAVKVSMLAMDQPACSIVNAACVVYTDPAVTCGTGLTAFVFEAVLGNGRLDHIGIQAPYGPANRLTVESCGADINAFASSMTSHWPAIDASRTARGLIASSCNVLTHNVIDAIGNDPVFQGHSIYVDAFLGRFEYCGVSTQA